METNSSENIINEFSIQAEKRPHKIALFLENSIITFQELDTKIWQISTFLKNKGVQQGDIVAIMYSEEIFIFITLLALARIGATSIVLQRQLPVIKLNEIIVSSRVNIIVSDNHLALDLKCLEINLSENIFDDRSLPIEFDIQVKNPKVPILLSMGSGSTGEPKIIPITHQQLRARLGLIHHAEDMNADDIILSLMDMSFTSTQFRSLAALCAGASVVLINTKDLMSISKYQVTNLGSALVHFEKILTNPPVNSKIFCQSLKILSIGFSTISDTLRQKIRNIISNNLYIGYGTNESGAVSMTSVSSSNDIPGTVGFPLPNVIVEVVNEQNEILPMNEIGHIRIKSPGMINGYLDNEEATNQAFKDGWFYPGDLGKLTEDGQLIHMGRADHMMIMNGMNIYPAEIEARITKHPAVLDAAVMPIKHPIYQDIPVCAVVLNDEYKTDKKELINFCYQALATSSPKEIIILEKIPRNKQGKLIRIELAQQIMAKLRNS